MNVQGELKINQIGLLGMIFSQTFEYYMYLAKVPDGVKW